MEIAIVLASYLFMVKKIIAYIFENRESEAAILAGIATIMATFVGYTSNQYSSESSKSYNKALENSLNSNAAYVNYNQILSAKDLLVVRKLLKDKLDDYDEGYLLTYETDLKMVTDDYEKYSNNTKESITTAQASGRKSDNLSLIAVLYAVVIFFTSMVSISRSRKIQIIYLFLSYSLFLCLGVALIFV
jgi:hypothetical protein